MDRTELRSYIRDYVDELIKQNFPFTVFDVTRLLRYYKDTTISHDEVRDLVQEYYYNNGFGQSWTRNIGNHLGFSPAPQIYYPIGYDINNYDPNRLNPSVYSYIFQPLFTTILNPVRNVKPDGVGCKVEVPKPVVKPKKSKPIFIKDANDKTVNCVLPFGTFHKVYSVKKKGENKWVGFGGRRSKAVSSLALARFYPDKNGPSQLLKYWDKRDWEIIPYIFADMGDN